MWLKSQLNRSNNKHFVPYCDLILKKEVGVNFVLYIGCCLIVEMTNTSLQWRTPNDWRSPV